MHELVWIKLNESKCTVKQWNLLHYTILLCTSRSHWPRGLRNRSAAARLLKLRVRIPPEAWMLVSCECCVLSGRGLCDGLIARPEESYRLWCVVVCDLDTSWMSRPWPTGGCCAQKNYVLDQYTRGKSCIAKTSNFAWFITITPLLLSTVRSLEKFELFKASWSVHAPHYSHIYVWHVA